MLAFGPEVDAPAPEFSVYSHNRKQHTLRSLLGERGLLVGFTGGIWNLANIRRVLWLQRYANTLEMAGVNVALLDYDDLNTLYDFAISSPVKIAFPLLADEDGQIHDAYQLQGRTALLLVDRGRVVRNAWYVGTDHVWTTPMELVQAVQTLDLSRV